MNTKIKKIISMLFTLVLICSTAYLTTDRAEAATGTGPSFTGACVNSSGYIDLEWTAYSGSGVKYAIYRATWDSATGSWSYLTNNPTSNKCWDRIATAADNLTKTSFTDKTIPNNSNGIYAYLVQAIDSNGNYIGNHIVCVRKYTAENADYLATTGNNKVTVAWHNGRTIVDTYVFYNIFKPGSSSSWGGWESCGCVTKDGKNEGCNSSVFKCSSYDPSKDRRDYVCSVNIPEMDPNNYYKFAIRDFTQYRATADQKESLKNKYTQNIVFDLQGAESSTGKKYSCSSLSVESGDKLFSYDTNHQNTSATRYDAELGLDGCIHFTSRSSLVDDFETRMKNGTAFYKECVSHTGTVSSPQSIFTMGNKFRNTDYGSTGIRFTCIAYEFQIQKSQITGNSADAKKIFYLRFVPNGSDNKLISSTALRKTGTKDEKTGLPYYEEVEMFSIKKETLLEEIAKVYNATYKPATEITLENIPENIEISKITPVITIADPVGGDMDYYTPKECGTMASVTECSNGSFTVKSKATGLQKDIQTAFNGNFKNFLKHFYGSETATTITIDSETTAKGDGSGTNYNKIYANTSASAKAILKAVYPSSASWLEWGDETKNDFDNYFFNIKINIPVHKPQKIYRVNASCDPKNGNPGISANNAALNKEGTGYSTGVTGWSVTNYIPVPDGCKEISIYFGGVLLTGRSCLHEYSGQSNNNYIDWWSSNTDITREITLNENTKYIRATFNTANLDNCYIKDETHGFYLYKGEGSNVLDGDKYRETGTGDWIWLTGSPYITFKHSPKATETNSTNSIYVTCDESEWDKAPGSSSTATDTVRVGYNGSYASTAMPQGINTYTINSRTTYNSGAEVNNVIADYKVAVDTVKPTATLGNTQTRVDTSGSNPSLSIDKYITFDDATSGLKTVTIKNSTGTIVASKTYTDTYKLGDTKTDSFYATIASGITDPAKYETALTDTYTYIVTDVAGNTSTGTFKPLTTTISDPVQIEETAKVGVGYSEGTSVISDSTNSNAGQTGWTYQWSYAYNNSFIKLTDPNTETRLGITATENSTNGNKITVKASNNKYKDITILCYVKTADGDTFVQNFCNVQVYGRANAPAITMKTNNSSGNIYSEGTWTNKDVYVTLGTSSIEKATATNETCYNGNASRRYKLNSNSYQTYNTGFTVSTEGTTSVFSNGYNTDWLTLHSGSYLSLSDNQATIKIDKTAPTISNLEPSMSSGKIKITAALADNLSGIASYSVAIKGNVGTKTTITGNPTSYSLNVVTNLTDASKTYTLTVYDAAGNSASWDFTLLSVKPLDNLRVNADGSASITVETTGASGLTYRWQYYNGSAWANITSNLKNSTFSGMTTKTLTISNANGNATQLPIRCAVSAGGNALYTYAASPKGDVTGNGVVDNSDVTKIGNYLKNTTTLDVKQLESADASDANATNKNIINTADKTAISNFIKGSNSDVRFTYPRIIVYGKPTVTVTYTANGASYNPVSNGDYTTGWTNKAPIKATVTASISSGTGSATAETYLETREYSKVSSYKVTKAGTWVKVTTSDSVAHTISADGIYGHKARAYNNWATASYGAAGAATSGETTMKELKLDTVAPTFSLSVTSGKTTIGSPADTLSGKYNGLNYSYNGGTTWVTDTTSAYTKDQQVSVKDRAGNIKTKKPTLQPLSVAKTDNIRVMSGGNGSVTAVPTGGSGVYSYQWQYHNGSAWASIPNGTLKSSTFSDANTATLKISNANVNSNQVLIRCVVTDAIQTDMTAANSLGLHPKGDVNNDGNVNNSDVSLITNYLGNKSGYAKQVTFESADADQNNELANSDKTAINSYVTATNQSTQPLKFSAARVIVFGTPSANISCKEADGDVYTMASSNAANASNWTNQNVTATITGTLNGGAGVCRVETRNSASDTYTVLADPNKGISGNSKTYTAEGTSYIGACAVNEWWPGDESAARSAETKGYIKIDQTVPIYGTVTNNGSTGKVTISDPKDGTKGGTTPGTWNPTTNESGIKRWKFSNDSTWTNATTSAKTSITNATAFTAGTKASFIIEDNAGNKVTIDKSSLDLATTKIENIRVVDKTNADKLEKAASVSAGSTATTTTGGFGFYSYQWQYFDEAKNDWVNIPNGTKLTDGELTGNTFSYSSTNNSNSVTNTLSISNALKPTTSCNWKLLRCKVTDGSTTVYSTGLHPKGDVNADGVVNRTDLTILQNYVNGSGSIARTNLESAATCNYTVINNDDTAKLQNYLNGTDNSLRFTYGRMTVFSSPSDPSISFTTPKGYAEKTWTRTDVTAKAVNSAGSGDYRSSQVKWKSGTDKTWTDGKGNHLTKTFTDTGKYTFSAQSYNTWWDDDSLISNTVSKEIWIDQTPPTYTATTTTVTENATHNGLVYTVTVHGAADANSGIATNAYSFDGGKTWQSSNSFSTENFAKVNIWVRDAAGNATFVWANYPTTPQDPKNPDPDKPMYPTDPTKPDPPYDPDDPVYPNPDNPNDPKPTTPTTPPSGPDAPENHDGYVIPHAYIADNHDVEVNAGGTKSTTVTAGGDFPNSKDIKYQWQYYSGGSWHNFPAAGTVLGSTISGGTSKDMTISNANTNMDQTPIRCQITSTATIGGSDYTTTVLTEMLNDGGNMRWPKVIVYGKPTKPVITGTANDGTSYDATKNPAPWSNKTSITITGNGSTVKGEGSILYQYSTDGGKTWINGGTNKAEQIIDKEGTFTVQFRAINTLHPDGEPSLISDVATAYISIDHTGPKAKTATVPEINEAPVSPEITEGTTADGKQQFIVHVPDSLIDWINYDTGIDINVVGEDIYPAGVKDISGLDDNAYSFGTDANGLPIWQPTGEYHFPGNANGDHTVLIRDKAGNITQVVITISGMQPKPIDLLRDLDIDLTGYTFGAPKTGDGDTSSGGYYMTYGGAVKEYKDKQTVGGVQYKGLMLTFETIPRVMWYVKGELTLEGYPAAVYPVYFENAKSDVLHLTTGKTKDIAHVVIDPSYLSGTTRANVNMTLTMTAYSDAACTIPVEDDVKALKSVTAKVNVDTLAPTISYSYNKYTGVLEAEIVDDLIGMERSDTYKAKGAFTVSGELTPTQFATVNTTTSPMKESLSYAVETSGIMVYTAYDKLHNRAEQSTNLITRVAPSNVALDYGWKTKHFYMTLINGND